jgi:hypothetical protein
MKPKKQLLFLKAVFIGDERGKFKQCLLCNKDFGLMNKEHQCKRYCLIINTISAGANEQCAINAPSIRPSSSSTLLHQNSLIANAISAKKYDTGSHYPIHFRNAMP